MKEKKKFIIRELLVLMRNIGKKFICFAGKIIYYNLIIN